MSQGELIVCLSSVEKVHNTMKLTERVTDFRSFKIFFFQAAKRCKV